MDDPSEELKPALTKIQKYRKEYRETNLEKLSKVAAEYYQENKDRLIARARTYWRDNHDKAIEGQRKYSRENREDLSKKQMARYYRDIDKVKAYYDRPEVKASRRAYMKEWREKNKARLIHYRKTIAKDILRENLRRRRAIMKGSSIGNEAIILAWEKTWRKKPRVRCYWCKGIFHGKDCHADHMIPLVPRNGETPGPHCIENMCISCSSCNHKKNAKSIEEWNKQLLQPVLPL